MTCFSFTFVHNNTYLCMCCSMTKVSMMLTNCKTGSLKQHLSISFHNHKKKDLYALEKILTQPTLMQAKKYPIWFTRHATLGSENALIANHLIKRITKCTCTCNQINIFILHSWNKKWLPLYWNLELLRQHEKQRQKISCSRRADIFMTGSRKLILVLMKALFAFSTFYPYKTRLQTLVRFLISINRPAKFRICISCTSII